MSTIHDLIGAGITAAHAAVGETVTFRGEALRTTVNRTPHPAEKKSWNLSERVQSVILLPGTLSPDPSPDRGESVSDGFGRSHRIIEYRRIGHWFYCGCVGSKP